MERDENDGNGNGELKPFFQRTVVDRMVDRARMSYPKLNGELSQLQFAALEGTRLIVGNGNDEWWEGDLDELSSDEHPSIVWQREFSRGALNRICSLQEEAPLEEGAA